MLLYFKGCLASLDRPYSNNQWIRGTSELNKISNIFDVLTQTFEKSIKNLFIKPVIRYVDRFLPFLIFKFSKWSPSTIIFFLKMGCMRYPKTRSLDLSKWCTQRSFRHKTILAQKNLLQPPNSFVFWKKNFGCISYWICQQYLSIRNTAIYTNACLKLTINIPVVYMGRYEVVLRGDYP